MDPCLIADPDGTGEIAHACVHTLHDLNLGLPTQNAVVEANEIVALDAGSRWLVEQHVPHRLVQPSHHDAPLRQVQLTRSFQQLNEVGVTAYDGFQSATLLLLRQQATHAQASRTPAWL
jgi:hypothetical protein